jgi:NTE family protein
VYDANHVFNKETLGFRVDTQDEIKAEKESWRLPPAKIEHFVDYLKAVIGYMTDMANKMHLHDNDWHRTVAIDASGVRATDFDLSDEKVKTLVANGRNGTEEYLKWFNDPNTNPPPLNRV